MVDSDTGDLEKAYDLCITSGCIRETEPEKDVIRSIVDTAKKGMAFIKEVSKNTKKESDHWAFVFRGHYDSLISLVYAYILLEDIQVNDHECRIIYICFKHPELELDWNFLEMIRLKKYAIEYRGDTLRYEDWNRMQLGFELHISRIVSEIEKKLADK